MYRLLFLFYIEAHPNLRYAPLDAEAYREGYGLERLRDLEMARLTTEESLNGHHLHLSIEQPVPPGARRLPRASRPAQRPPAEPIRRASQRTRRARLLHAPAGQPPCSTPAPRRC